ncbi:MAG: helix-turn-helix transcriptional regulator [Verrucomicrobiae bacterium]|nr:helix-turn-helix transcriptional regulator [Verrucomicrobiae bacterium]
MPLKSLDRTEAQFLDRSSITKNVIEGFEEPRVPRCHSRNTVDQKLINREILLSFWKIHILHHAEEGEVVGHWMLEELRHHGYEVSPGTLYPILKRMESNGWLVSTVQEGAGSKAPRAYRITEVGKQVLEVVRRQMAELGFEVIERKGGLPR